MRLGTGRSRAGRPRERGAVLVEFVLVAPVLGLLLLGLLELGNAWRQVGSLERAAQQGARAVTAQSNHRYADFEALRAVDSAMRGLSGMTVQRVIIYKSTNADGSLPSQSCLNGSVANLCNTYTGSVLTDPNPTGFPGGGTGTPSCAGGLDAGWCPLGRSRTATPPLRIGVHITVEYTPVTGLLPGPTLTYERNAVYQIDPCPHGQSSC